MQPMRAAAPTQVKEAEATTSTPADAPTPSFSGRRVVLESEEELRSTWEHRFWVGGTTALLVATLANGLVHVSGFDDVVGVVLAGMAAYVLSDLGTGIYHWGVDNYGDAHTPLVGSQIAAFQGHHQRPWTITEREFANNVSSIRDDECVCVCVCVLQGKHLPVACSFSLFSSAGFPFAISHTL